MAARIVDSLENLKIRRGNKPLQSRFGLPAHRLYGQVAVNCDQRSRAVHLQYGHHDFEKTATLWSTIAD